MKRTVALTILGVAAAATTTAYGQGAFQFSNYDPTQVYVPIAYDATVPGFDGALAKSADGIVIEVWWGEGSNVDTLGGIANFSNYDGYTDQFQVFELPPDEGSGGWLPGETWSLQLRASGQVGGVPVIGAGPIVTTDQFGNQGVTPPELPVFHYTPGFTVSAIPEPTTFALAGLGAAALLIFRRRD